MNNKEQKQNKIVDIRAYTHRRQEIISTNSSDHLRISHSI